MNKSKKEAKKVLMNERQQRRANKHASICAEYSNLLTGEVRPFRVITFLSEKYDMTVQGIYEILKRYGCYKTKNRGYESGKV